jgi:uncharacterized protein YoxC
LTQQIQGKEAELERERQSVKALTEQVRSLQTTSNEFEVLAEHSKEILQKLEEQNAQAEQRHETATEGFRDKSVALKLND